MKFLLIDDHALIREALQNVLKELAGDATILEASDCRQAQILIEQNADLEVILLDLNQLERVQRRDIMASDQPPIPCLRSSAFTYSTASLGVSTMSFTREFTSSTVIGSNTSLNFRARALNSGSSMISR